MGQVETVKVVDGDGFKSINKDEFDPSQHEEYKEKAKTKAKVDSSKDKK